MTMSKRAAIYIRVSTEIQAEKVSPHIQEADCRALCQQRGYTVFEIFRDVEKYRVGRRMVEPSGTRADRPELRRMLALADDGQFDVIVAWREDRLYRGFRPMLDVLECLERNKMTIELARDHFDPSIAPVKAWAAKVELDAKRERQIMGVGGRMAAGKGWASSTPLGYVLKDDRPQPDPDTAHWVQAIYKWYADGVTLHEIRRHLIAANAPQRYRRADDSGAAWKLTSIKYILKNPVYHSGYQVMTWGGEEYRIPYPPIVDLLLAERVANRRQQNKAYPARHIKLDFLAGGLLHCEACGVRMAARTVTNRQRKNGAVYTYTLGMYRCNDYVFNYHGPNCARTIASQKVDSEMWAKVWPVIEDEACFNQIVMTRVNELRSQSADAQAELDRIERQLGELTMERQAVITMARKKLISEADLNVQLGTLQAQESSLSRERDEKGLLVGDHADLFLERVSALRRDLCAGRDILNAELEDADHIKRQFDLRRRVVETLVKRVNVRPDKSLEVVMEFSALAPAEMNQSSQSRLLAR
jgi:DNA invertase Pin-like site-specific DNA recombinase